jgi:hypothetical protein
MLSMVERIRAHIQDPKLTTSANAFAPRRHDLYPPTTLTVVEAAEAKMGFRLPPLLRELYTQVGNGGFGPGYGIFGLEGGYIEQDIVNNFQGGTLVEWYFAFRGTDNRIPELKHDFDFGDDFNLFIDPEPKPETWGWFDKLVPVCNHGCWQLSCIDCSKPTFPVLFYVGYESELRLANHTFDEWIENWLLPPSSGHCKM